MKTRSFLKLLAGVISILAFTFILKSCKKTDSNAVNKQTAEAARAAAIASIKEKYGNVSAGFIIPVNKQAGEYFYKNAAGNMVSLYNNKNNKPTPESPGCLYNCNNTSNPADLTLIYTLDYIQRLYKCESSSMPGDKKSMISVSWTISVPFGITYLTSDNVPNTFGNIKFSPSGSSPVTLTANPGSSDFTVTYLGSAAPGCYYNSLYRVSYSFDDVPNSYMLSGTTIEASIGLDNDCALLGYVVATGLTAAPVITDELDLPCERIDKVWVTEDTGPNSCSQATGNYSICSYPSGLSPIDYHEVEYRLVTSGTSLLWDDQVSGSTVHWGEPFNSNTDTATLNPSTGTYDLVNMTPTSGIWLVRYRNVKTSVCDAIYGPGFPPTPNGDWGNTALWIVEVWDRSY